METARLVYMANQIGQFFRAQGEAATVAGVENHLRRFWDPRMREEIVTFARTDGRGLDPDVRAAVERLGGS